MKFCLYMCNDPTVILSFNTLFLDLRLPIGSYNGLGLAGMGGLDPEGFRGVSAPLHANWNFLGFFTLTLALDLSSYASFHVSRPWIDLYNVFGLVWMVWRGLRSLG